MASRESENAHYLAREGWAYTIFSSQSGITLFLLSSIYSTTKTSGTSSNWYHHVIKDYIKLLQDIPETIRKDARSTPYNVSYPIKQSGVRLSPIWLRSKAASTESAQCDPEANDPSPRDKSDKHSDNEVNNDNDGRDMYPDSSTCPPTGSEPPSKRSKQTSGQRPYCTQQCLLGLLQRSQLDEQCSNVDEHRKSDGCRPCEKP